MLKVGDCIKVKTKTLNDVFGEVVYRVKQLDVHCPDCKEPHAILFTMLGGSGPAARAGYPVVDCPKRIRQDLTKGITQILTPAQAAAAIKHYGSGEASHSGREIEM